MRQLLRPLFIIVLASFFVGVWYSLSQRESPQEPQGPISDDPLIIMARYPQLWQDLLHPLIEGQRIPIEIRSSGLNQYPETLRTCDLVESRSDFIHALVEQNLVQPFSKEYAAVVSMVHPDFFPPGTSQEGTRFFPVLWASYAWTAPDSSTETSWTDRWDALANQAGSVGVYGDYETLLSSFLKHEDWPTADDDGEVDDEMLLLNQWVDSWITRVAWKFGHSQQISPSMEERTLRVTSHIHYTLLQPPQILPGPELVVWGLSPCLKAIEHPAMREVLNFLAQGENQINNLKKYGLASTLNSSLHWSNSDRPHSALALRDLNYSQITWRRVNWDNLVLWDQILRARISPATEQ